MFKCPLPFLCVSQSCMRTAMVYTDNKVALRQLEAANKLILNHTSLHSYEGTSIAKDGKFHPRVLTLVGTKHAPSYQSWGLSRTDREVIILSLGLSSVGSMASMDPSGEIGHRHMLLFRSPSNYPQCHPF